MRYATNSCVVITCWSSGMFWGCLAQALEDCKMHCQATPTHYTKNYISGRESFKQDMTSVPHLVVRSLVLNEWAESKPKKDI